ETIDTSKRLEAKPIHGCHWPLRSRKKIASDTPAASSVTTKPATCIGSCIRVESRLYVGEMSSSAIATSRTRATTYSPSMPAAASAGSGADHTGVVGAPLLMELDQRRGARGVEASSPPASPLTGHSVCAAGRMRGHHHPTAVSTDPRPREAETTAPRHAVATQGQRVPERIASEQGGILCAERDGKHGQRPGPEGTPNQHAEN